MVKTLGSADITIALSIDSIYIVPQLLEKFGADDIFNVESRKLAETVETVDGYLEGGYVYSATVQSYTIQPTSDSARMIQDWVQISDTQKTLFKCDAVTTYPGLNMKFFQSRGIMFECTPMPSAGKLIKPIQFKIRWQRVVGVSL